MKMFRKGHCGKRLFIAFVIYMVVMTCALLINQQRKESANLGEGLQSSETSINVVETKSAEGAD